MFTYLLWISQALRESSSTLQRCQLRDTKAPSLPSDVATATSSRALQIPNKLRQFRANAPPNDRDVGPAPNGRGNIGIQIPPLGPWSLRVNRAQFPGCIDGNCRRPGENPGRVRLHAARTTPRQVAVKLGKRGIATWDGDYYAYELIRAIGLAESGGMVRVGLVHYNEPAEIERLAQALREIAESAAANPPA